jgi:hypothetical protein
MAGTKDPQNTVFVYTWPYQWVYEPAYWALGVLAARGWQFEYVTGRVSKESGAIEEFKTDKDVLDAFDEGGSELRIALCEPPARPGYRLIPLLWHLPVWALLPETHAASLGLSQDALRFAGSPENAHLLTILKQRNLKVYRFPDESTTGRFARDFLYAMRKRDGGVPENVISQYEPLSQFVDRFLDPSGPTTTSGEVALAFSYTPLHAISDRVIAVHEIPGIADRVTAVVFPQDVSERRELERLRQGILEFIKLNISALYFTSDLDSGIGELVKRHDLFLASSLSRAPSYCEKPEDVARLLGVFVQRGCFFPYCVMDASLQPDLFSMFRQTLNEHAETMQNWFSAQFRDFVSPGLDWSQLSYKTRYDILSFLIASADGKENDSLVHRLLHLAGTHDQAINTFKQKVVSHQTLPITPLQMVRFPNRDFSSTGSPLVCPGRAGDELPGYCGCRDARQGKQPCLLCTLLSGQATLSWQVDDYLSSSLPSHTPRVEYKSWRYYKRDPERSEFALEEDFRWSVVGFDDLKPMCDIFLGTLIHAPQAVSAKVKALTIKDPKKCGSRLLFSIETTKTSSRSGPNRGGNASDQLRKWLADQRGAVLEVWFYYRDGFSGKRDDPRTGRSWFRLGADQQQDVPSWVDQVKGHLDQESQFAYVAVLGSEE